MNSLVSEMQELALFSGIDKSELENIASNIQKLYFSEGSVIFNEGEEAKGMYIITKGDVKARRITSDGREVVLFISRAGYLIGEGAVFQDNTHPSTAVATTNVSLLFLSKKLCYELANKYPSFSLRLLKLFSVRQRMLIHKLAAQGERNALTRISAYILHRYFLEGATKVFTLHLSREDLANLLGFARETVSRQLSLLVEYNAIQLDGRTIHILDEELLKSISEGG